MNQRQPSLLWHEAKGVWYVKYTIRDSLGNLRPKWVYFGPDKKLAQEGYDREMLAWREHRNRRNAELRTRPTVRRERMRVADVVDKFYDARETRGRSPLTLAFLRNSLRRFLGVYGDQDAGVLCLRNLQDFHAWLCRIKPEKGRQKGGKTPPERLSDKTIAHELASVKSLCRWAAAMGFMQPMALDLIQPPDLPDPRPRGYTLADAKRMHRLAPEHLKPYILMTWLTACRPTEAVRLGLGLFDWLDDREEVPANQQRARERWGLAKLHHKASKTPNRIILFSPAALTALARIDGRYRRTDSYSTACDRHCDGMRPHFLRHGSAQYMGQRLRAARADVDTVLGHVPSRVSRAYQPIDWKALRALVARIPSL